jgi:hypothetical protein
MNKITATTRLIQGGKEYQPVEVDGVIYWVDKTITPEHKEICCFVDGFKTWLDEYLTHVKFTPSIFKIIAQSQPILKGIPVITLNSYVQELAEIAVIEKGNLTNEREQIIAIVGWVDGYYQKEFTLADIEKAFELGQESMEYDIIDGWYSTMNKQQCIEQISTIDVIEVDDSFNVIKFS